MTDVYTAITEAPLDDYSVPDQGDQGLEVKLLAKHKKAIAAKSQPSLIIPFTRTLSLGSVDKDVVGAKRAIWKANGHVVKDSFSRIFGPITASELKQFQKGAGLVADGQLGPATLKKLAPFFDQYAFLLYAGYPPGGSKTQQIRNRTVAYALWAYNNRVRIGYVERRPMENLNNLLFLPEDEDCSELVTKEFKAADGPDPNGMSPPFNGFGNTATMRAHGRRVTLNTALPGDTVHYDNPQHVALYVGNGRVVSHGSAIGPLLLSASYRTVVQVRSYL